MRSLKNISTIFAILIGLAVAVNADEGEKAKESEAPKELKNQTNCPVMGGKIDSTIYTDIQGQRVYHCCPMCSAKLKADPDKYFKKAAEEGVLFENIQTNCPVSGDSLENKSVYLDFEGRRIAFCCKDCIEKFKAEPEKFLKSMDEGKGAEKAEKMEEMEHEDHSEHHH